MTTTLGPVDVMAEIDTGAARLDALERGLSKATSMLDEAEARWLEVYDATADTLKDEMEQANRKGDPPEHWILSRARKENRVAFSNYRQAKSLVARLEKQIKAKQTVVSARQTQLNALRDEGRGQYSPQPQGQTFGRRAA